MNIQSIAGKFRMIGKSIKGYNDFGLLYEDKDDLIFLKQTGDRVEKIEGLDCCMVGKHFIIVQSQDEKLHLYIKDSANDQLDGIDTHAIHYPNFGAFMKTMIREEKLNDTELVVILDQQSRMFILNYAGEKLDISRYRDHDPFKDLIIEYNANATTYSIGYKASFFENSRTAKRREIILNRYDIIKSITKDLNLVY